MNKAYFLLVTLLLCSCGHQAEQSDAILSMQVIDRNGFTETISNKERLSSFENTDFLTPQPFQKVLRVYKRNAATGKSSSKITSYHENGQVWQYLEAVNGRAHGTYSEWFPSGQLNVEANVIEGVADIHDLAKSTWVFEGLCKVWNEQGALVGEFYYEKGYLHTPARYYFPTGALQKIIPYKQGEIDGVIQVFDEKGNVLEEVPYEKNQKQGTATLFWSPDQLLSKEIYEKGLLIQAVYYDKTGARVAEVKQGVGQKAEFSQEVLATLWPITRGRLEGKVQLFHPNGSLHATYEILDDKKHGEEWEYYPCSSSEQPRPKLYLYWQDDKIQGLVKTWYPTGQIESQREMNDNKKQGSAYAWYKNGDLMLMEEYENDLLMKGSYYKKGDKQAVSRIDAGRGVATLYTSEGIFTKKVTYERGRPVL